MVARVTSRFVVIRERHNLPPLQFTYYGFLPFMHGSEFVAVVSGSKGQVSLWTPDSVPGPDGVEVPSAEGIRELHRMYREEWGEDVEIRAYQCAVPG